MLMRSLALAALLVLAAACGGSDSPTSTKADASTTPPKTIEWHVDPVTDWFVCDPSADYQRRDELPDGERKVGCNWMCGTYEGVAGRVAVVVAWRGSAPGTWEVVMEFVTPASQAPDTRYGCTSP